MAASQSSTPPVRRSIKPAKKRFTLAEANRTLPLVKRIVSDIVDAHRDLSDLHDQLTELKGPTKLLVQEKFERRVERMQALVAELNVVGAEIKDYATGLIDFVGRHQGHDVYLCWRLGEERVDHFHELDAGFAGRQPAERLEEHA